MCYYLDMSETEITTLAAQTYEAQHAAEQYSQQLHREVKTTAAQQAQWMSLCEERDRLQAQAGGPVFLIPEHNLPVLTEKVLKLNKAAAKLGCEPITLTSEPGPVYKRARSSEGPEVIIERFYVIVAGKAPKLDGWSFVATLEHDEGTVILRRMPTFEGEVDLTAYRTADPENCDHCHTRRRRSDTYVVAHEDGTLKQVGSNCLRDFLGHTNPAQIARFCEMIADLMDGFDSAEHDLNEDAIPQGDRRIETETFLAHTACMIRIHGWTSKGSARITGAFATAEEAEQNIYLQSKRIMNDGKPTWITPTDEDVTLAEQAITWVRELTEEEIAPNGSDYLYNLHTIISKDSIRYRQMGIAASAISAYSRAVEKEIKRKAAAAGRSSQEFIGTIKKRETFELTLLKITWIEDRYSFNSESKPLLIMADQAGNPVKWFASDLPAVQRDEAYAKEHLERHRYPLSCNRTGPYTLPVVGGTYKVKATVVRHQDDETYGKATLVNRCVFLQVVSEPTEAEA